MGRARQRSKETRSVMNGLGPQSPFMCFFLAAALVITVPLAGALRLSFFDLPKPHGEVFTADEWRRAQNYKGFPDDAVLINDGTVLLGKFDSLPALKYSFGEMKLDVSDIALVAFLDEGSLVRAQYITRKGESYVAPLSIATLTFWAKEDGGDEPVKRRIDPRTVDAIVMASKGLPQQDENKALFTIEFKNGDQLPVIPALEVVRLTDGWNEHLLKVGDILDVRYNGGLQGNLREGSKESKELSFSLVKDKYFCAHFANGKGSLKLPWDKIASIQGYNSGFMQNIAKVEERNSGKVSYDHDDGQDLIAFAPEAFEAFMQPIPPRISPPLGLNQAGVSAVYDHRALAPIPPPPASLGVLEQTEERLFLAADFDAPFFIAYDLGYHEEELGSGSFLPKEKTMSRSEYFVEAQHVTVPEEAFLDEGCSELAMVSGSDLNKINEELLFEHLPVLDVDPVPFDVEDLAFITSDQEVPKKPLEIASLSLVVDMDFDRGRQQARNDGRIKAAMVPTYPLSLAVDMDFDRSRQLARNGGRIKTAMVPTYPFPQMWVEFGGFLIDREPVTNAEYRMFIDETGRPPPVHWPQGDIPVGMEMKPVVNVSYEDAASYAQWVGKRLPTEIEWEDASLHKDFVAPPALKEWVDTSFLVTTSSGTWEKVEGAIPFRLPQEKYHLITGMGSQELSIMHEGDSNSSTTFRCVSFY